MIGDDIEITIVDIRGDKVRLGITAPATIPVHRKEVYEAIQRENREAARVKMEDLQSLPRGKPTAVSPPPPGMHRSPASRPGERKDMPPASGPQSNGTAPSSPQQSGNTGPLPA
jgi:carbon storage regulator